MLRRHICVREVRTKRRRASLPAVLAAAALLAACSPPTPTPLPPPTHVWTALEAYEQIRPAMLAWHDDALAVNACAVIRNAPAWDLRPDGRSPCWSFTVVSAKAQKQTAVDLIDTSVRVGIDVEGREAGYLGGRDELPFDQMIDSTQAVTIAQGLGLDAHLTLRRINTEWHVDQGRQLVSPYWTLVYGDPRDVSWGRTITVDMLTGQVLGDEVWRWPDTPTPSPSGGAGE